jgi:hypothetical protein
MLIEPEPFELSVGIVFPSGVWYGDVKRPCCEGYAYPLSAKS